MQHNHKDHHSQPLDALTPEMQNQWELLMEQCFPGYSKVFAKGIWLFKYIIIKYF